MLNACCPNHSFVSFVRPTKEVNSYLKKMLKYFSVTELKNVYSKQASYTFIF